MSTTELLDQFVQEARECLEQIGERLLQVERAPGDAALLNDLFRLVHTLKGNCGLFDFKPLELLVHAGEDLLDRVRSGQLSYSGQIADALLDAMDLAIELVERIASDGRLDDSRLAQSQALAQQIRARLNDGKAATAAAADAATASTLTPATAPDWINALPEAQRSPGRVLLRYRPEPECFFKGEDPLRLAMATPGLRHLDLAPGIAWPEDANFDCYQCRLDFLLSCDAPPAYVNEHYRYVPEQIESYQVPAASVPAPAVAAANNSGTSASSASNLEATQALLARRALQIWDEQRRLLEQGAPNAASLRATREVFAHLLQVLACEGTAGDGALVPDLDASLSALMQVPENAAAVLAWSAQHRPGSGAKAAGAGNGNSSSGEDPSQESGAGSAGHGERGERGQRVLKVNQDKIDRLMGLIGEMVVAKNALPYLAQRAETLYGQRDLAREIKTQYAVINRIAEDMQHAIMQVRMLPVGTIFQRFGRLVRDTSKRLGKEVRLVIEGEDTEADKNVIESLADPLIHILRNSLDHGIESPAQRLAAGKPAMGTLRVSARQEGDRVLLDISDDGAGVATERVRAKAVERGLIPAERAELLSEQEAVQLIFLPGFSTADAISDLSGRGVGMDVVRSAVERVNGVVSLSSERGQGTRIRLSLPLSMAVTNVMMIETAGIRFGVPMDLIIETVRVPAEDIHHFKSAQTAVLRGRVVPLRTLNSLLDMPCPPSLNSEGEHAVLLVRLGQEPIGLIVDEFHGTSDIILKPLDGVLAGLTAFAGTALMGDGSVLMIINPKELL
ncbi:chemotaxis protein CheW [Roseateles sp.]|uniref:chemotaxis protein CheA n=1 Tax=Roseateles sp. TaxID=1971397 RepID=UPI003D0A69F7